MLNGLLVVVAVDVVVVVVGCNCFAAVSCCSFCCCGLLYNQDGFFNGTPTPSKTHIRMLF